MIIIKIEELCEKIDNIKNDGDKEQDLFIMNIYLKKLIIEKENTGLLENYQRLAESFLSESNNAVNLDEDIIVSILRLKEFIRESSISKCLEENHIKKYSLGDLKNYIYKYGNNEQELVCLNDAIDLIQILEKILTNEKKKVFYMSHSLNNIVGKNLLNRCNDITKIDDRGVENFSRVNKSKEEYARNRYKALDKLTRMFIYERKIDINPFKYAVQMINQIYDNYFFGFPKLKEFNSAKKLVK